jgi:hypothetical protein
MNLDCFPIGLLLIVIFSDLAEMHGDRVLTSFNLDYTRPFCLHREEALVILEIGYSQSG